MNILIVDDSRLLRLSNERALVKAGHNVISAEDGEAGLRLALEHKPDLVVLDMMLPKLSGQDVLRALRQDPGLGLVRPSPVQRKQITQRRRHRVLPKVRLVG